MSTRDWSARIGYRIPAAWSKAGQGGVEMIAYLACMIAVAHVTGLPPRLLPVIQSIEGGAVGMVRQDPNGTADLGVMQINTVWLPALAARAGLSPAVTRDRLIDDPCFNIAAAALILRHDLTQTGRALLPAIGDYHSHTPSLNQAYAALAENRATQLFSR